MPAGARSDHFPAHKKNNQLELQKARARAHTNTYTKNGTPKILANSKSLPPHPNRLRFCFHSQNNREPLSCTSAGQRSLKSGGRFGHTAQQVITVSSFSGKPLSVPWNAVLQTWVLLHDGCFQNTTLGRQDSRMMHQQQHPSSSARH